jgi:dnd system-associated protein 4
MLERRINYSKSKAEVIRRLQGAEDSTGPFTTIADVLAFAAALGLKRNRRRPLAEPLAESIRQSVFDNKGFDTMMNLIALHALRKPTALADGDDAIEERASIFEEFANGGLEVLEEEIRGATDPLETIVLLVNAERARPDQKSGAFELSKLMS